MLARGTRCSLSGSCLRIAQRSWAFRRRSPADPAVRPALHLGAHAVSPVYLYPLIHLTFEVWSVSEWESRMRAPFGVRKDIHQSFGGKCQKRHSHTTEKGKVVDFVVQLEVKVGGAWKAIIRYDCAHDFAHVDRYNRNGE